jgi:hypothetical protein
MYINPDICSWIYLYEYGNCYQFNSGRNYFGKPIQMRNTSIQGSEHGFNVEIRLPNKNKYPTSWSSGLVVFVHEPNYSPLDSPAIYLQRGKLANLALKRVTTDNYPHPYSDCVEVESLRHQVSET